MSTHCCFKNCLGPEQPVKVISNELSDIPVFAEKRKQLSRCCSGGAGELQRRMSVVAVFILLASAAGQDVGGNAGTNQPGAQIVSTNPVPGQVVEAQSPPAAATNLFEAENSLTNQFGLAPMQQPLLGPRTVGSTQLTSPLMGTSVFAAPPGAGFAPAPLGPGIPLWGPVDVHPQMFNSLTYGNGIESQPGQQKKTFVDTISPGLLFDLGSYWKLDYTPSYAVYSDPAFRNTLAESVLLSGRTTYEDWTLNIAQTYAKTDDPLIETGAQTEQEAYGTTLGAAYQMSSKLTLQLGASQVFSFADQFDSVRAWTGSSGLNCQIIPQFGMGLSLSGGYNDMSVGSSMPFESYQGTMNFRPGKKLSLTLSGGVEDTQFVHPSAPSLLTPIFSGSLRYQLFPATSISLSGSRSANPSYFGNQLEVATSVGGSIQQQLSKKLSLAFNAGYSTEPLTSIVPGPLPQYFLGTPPRTTLTEDLNNNSTSFGASLSYAVIKRGTISVFYSVNDNSSSQANYSYSSHQVGLSLSYRY